MAKSYRLTMTQGPEPGYVFPLDIEKKDSFTLGRDPRNDVMVSHTQVSRRHARITRQGDRMVIEDLGSTNGTFVSGTRLTGQYTLVNGDVISLGKVVMLAYHEAEPPERKLVEDHPTVASPQQTPAISTEPFESSDESMSSPLSQDQQETRTWLWVGCGCLVLLLLAACITMFILDYFRVLPTFFYEPLRWLRLI